MATSSKKQHFRISVRALFGILFFLLMAGTILLNALLNSVFLERYYVSGRKNALIHVYNAMQDASVYDILETDGFDRSLHTALRQTNTSLLVVDSSTRTVKVWSADESLMEERLYANLFDLTPFEEDAAATSAERDDESVVRGTEETESKYVITQIIEKNHSYTLHVVLDRTAGTKSMEMWGPLGDSSYFLLRSPLEDIRSSALLATRFSGYTGILLAIAGAAFAWWLSRWITEPIRQLTAISERMKALDFGVKYKERGRTELDLLGANMNELSQKLEETISALRTANNELQRDIDRRDRQEEMRQEFLASVTHELKTPIALIRGYAEGLQDGIADDPDSRSFYLDTILEESDKMNKIVQNVLMLNQLEFGGGSVEMERFDLAGMIRNYLESASLLAQQNGVQLLFDEKEPVYAWGDPFLIQEVFQNYYSNALHYVQPAEGGSEKVIEIRCERRGETVRVTVFNTGQPIPEASLPHIWEKFYKVDKARTRAYGGSGVGLSIVKAIMELHHRGYGVENYENGTAFWFELDGSNPGMTFPETVLF